VFPQAASRKRAIIEIIANEFLNPFILCTSNNVVVVVVNDNHFHLQTYHKTFSDWCQSSN
jgi:hypothetical protein